MEGMDERLCTVSRALPQRSWVEDEERCHPLQQEPSLRDPLTSNDAGAWPAFQVCSFRHLFTPCRAQYDISLLPCSTIWNEWMESLILRWIFFFFLITCISPLTHDLMGCVFRAGSCCSSLGRSPLFTSLLSSSFCPDPGLSCSTTLPHTHIWPMGACGGFRMLDCAESGVLGPIHPPRQRPTHFHYYFCAIGTVVCWPHKQLRTSLRDFSSFQRCGEQHF